MTFKSFLKYNDLFLVIPNFWHVIVLPIIFHLQYSDALLVTSLMPKCPHGDVRKKI